MPYPAPRGYRRILRILLAPPTPLIRAAGRPDKGGVAQLGERLLCKQEVIGSIPFTSTTDSAQRWRWCVAVAAAVTRRARHASERTRTG